MPQLLSLLLTDELWAFVDRKCGDGTPYASPSEYVLSLLHEQKLRQKGAEARDAILEGYQDAIAGLMVEFRGDLRSLLRKVGK